MFKCTVEANYVKAWAKNDQAKAKGREVVNLFHTIHYVNLLKLLKCFLMILSFLSRFVRKVSSCRIMYNTYNTHKIHSIVSCSFNNNLMHLSLNIHISLLLSCNLNFNSVNCISQGHLTFRPKLAKAFFYCLQTINIFWQRSLSPFFKWLTGNVLGVIFSETVQASRWT